MPATAERSPSAPVRRRIRFRRPGAGAAKRHFGLVLSAVLSAEIVLWAGVGTDWFGLAASGSSSGTTAQGPNPNPYNETVQHVYADVTYTGNLTGYFPALEGVDICNHCPARPFTDDEFTPPVAGFWFYFNVTNKASYDESITNFTLATSGANPELFVPGYALVGYPTYLSRAARVQFLPDQTIGMAAFVYAVSIPDVGPGGFVLYFNVTAP